MKPASISFLTVLYVSRFLAAGTATAPVVDADAKSVVESARTAARDDIATAYKKFMQKTPTDPGFRVLNDLYSLANREYYQGNHDLNRALLASGSAAPALLARAPTAYTCSQAHAMQLYDAMVAPATNPLNLGLGPFGGSWAEWETPVGKPPSQ